MNRLPIRFEQEALSTHNLCWCGLAREYARRCENHDDAWDIVSEYELAGIALEAMKNDMWFKPEPELEYWELNHVEVGKFEYICHDKDFCTCVFEAVNNVFGGDKE